MATCAVYAAANSVQDPAQVLVGAVKISQIQNVENRNARLNRHRFERLVSPRQGCVEGAQPRLHHRSGLSILQGLSDSAQSDKLVLRHQPRTYQGGARRSREAGVVQVVVGDGLVEGRNRGNRPAEGAEFAARQQVSVRRNGAAVATAIPGQIAAENASAVARNRNSEIERKGAVEVGNYPEAKAPGQFSRSAKGNLVPPIQTVGSDRLKGAVVVHGRIDKVPILRCSDVLGKRV